MKKPPKRRPGKKRRQQAATPALPRARLVKFSAQISARPSPIAPVRQESAVRPAQRHPTALRTTPAHAAAARYRKTLADAARLAVPFAVIACLIGLQAALQAPALLWDRGAEKPLPLVAAGTARRIDQPDNASVIATREGPQSLVEPAGPQGLRPVQPGNFVAAQKAALITAQAAVALRLSLDAVAALPLAEHAVHVAGQPARQAIHLASPAADPLGEMRASLISVPVTGGIAEISLAGRLPDERLQPSTAAPLFSDRAPDRIAAKTILTAAADRGICTLDQAQARPASPPRPTGLTSEAFGAALAHAAEAQTANLIVYNEVYRSIAYPGGDVSPLYGVCTDVVIRAFRAVGIDLQVLVRQSRAGAGDPSIDHRRTEVLRRFFERAGASLPVTPFADQYRPGDIVTYHRPQNNGVPSHIAIVSNYLGASGRPMIVHNRGSGVQLEDALFVNAITGHYRFDGTHAARILAAQTERPQRATLLAKRRMLTARSLRSLAGLKAADLTATQSAARLPF